MLSLKHLMVALAVGTALIVSPLADGATKSVKAGSASTAKIVKKTPVIASGHKSNRPVESKLAAPMTKVPAKSSSKTPAKTTTKAAKTVAKTPVKAKTAKTPAKASAKTKAPVKATTKKVVASKKSTKTVAKTAAPAKRHSQV